jgi:predicted nucleic acid-binding protein
VLSWIEPAAGNVVIVSELVLVEMQSLIARRLREQSLTASAANKLRSDFLIHYRDDYLVVHLDTQIADAAGDLVTQHKLRSLDAIQLASARHALRVLKEPMIFIAGDINLLIAAQAESFTIDDPNQHP